MTPTPTAATPTPTPEELARIARLRITKELCGFLGFEAEEIIAAAIRQHSEAQRAEIERLTKERDELRARDHSWAATFSRLDAEANEDARKLAAALERERAMREALTGLADVMEGDCGAEPCIGSMAPAEHYLGLARAALSAKEATDER